ncbi:MAG TPA: adenylate/guanylate cyclase domain-containing protein [Ignavibacteria bacterium]|nr:adenylate/guanylate cyclase domain-containing protein [Ignavibacteria bacterium]HMR40015.1 adenylate/guanylate cyclase domain-containing protein [Ignavibacteria bacterium]
MKLSRQTKRNLNSIKIFTISTSIGAVILALLDHGLKPFAILDDLIIGFLFGLIISTIDIYFFSGNIRRVSFTTSLIIRTLFFTVISAALVILVGILNIGSRFGKQYYDVIRDNGGSLMAYIRSEEFSEIIIYLILLSFFINFILQINRLLGQNVLLNYLRGKYQFPLEEELIFMFLDLKSSTTIAEKLGLLKNHEFLNDFFHDMTEPILEYKGRIYQYVGDEIVLTWKPSDGLDYNNCINCFFAIQNKIILKKDYYIKEYGVYPEFKAGLHMGPVITGEMGEIKKDIVYHGDTINTAARIQSECNNFRKRVLISLDLKNELDLEGHFITESMGNIILRGKEKELELFSVDEIHPL